MRRSSALLAMGCRLRAALLNNPNVQLPQLLEAVTGLTSGPPVYHTYLSHALTSLRHFRAGTSQQPDELRNSTAVRVLFQMQQRRQARAPHSRNPTVAARTTCTSSTVTERLPCASQVGGNMGGDSKPAASGGAGAGAQGGAPAAQPGWLLQHCPPQLLPYTQLMRLEKPIGAWSASLSFFLLCGGPAAQPGWRCGTAAAAAALHGVHAPGEALRRLRLWLGCA